MPVIIDDVVAEFGAYYIDNGQNMTNLRDAIRTPSETESYFTSMPTNNTRERSATITGNRVLQLFQAAWTPIGNPTFKPHWIDLSRQKIDYEDIPDTLDKSWLAFLRNGSLNRVDWPFTRWLLEVYLIAQMKEDMELGEIYKGVVGSITPGTANASGQNYYGIKQIIKDQVAASVMPVIVTGALSATDATFIGQIETFVAGMPSVIQDKGGEIFMNKTRFKQYRQAKRAKYNSNYAAEDLETIFNFESWKVVGLNSMAGSNKIWATHKDNRINWQKNPENQNIFKVEERQRKLSIYTDFHRQVDFNDYRYVFTNDLENA